MSTSTKVKSIANKLVKAHTQLTEYETEDKKKKSHITKAKSYIEKALENASKILDKEKKPLNSYMEYAKSVRPQVVARLGKNATVQDVAKEIGKMWKEYKEDLEDPNMWLTPPRSSGGKNRKHIK